MPAIRSFAEAREVLKQYYHNPETHTYTLERMRELVDFLGNPQDKLKIIHIAGTSGKSSTAFYASALLQTAGAKIGLTVSPHVFEINERVQINNTPLPESEFCDKLGKFIDLVQSGPVRPSYFELMVAFAYHEFAQRHVDYAVVEVGLGGLIDGTNVVSREDKVCVITDIGLDHTNVLGKTLREIAAQKAGIILPHNNVFTYEQAPEIMQVIRDTAHQKSAVLHEFKAPDLSQSVNGKLPLFQQRNLFLASQAVDFVLQREKRKTLTESQLSKVAPVQIPGRMQTFNVNGKTLIIDGAHNGQKMAALVESMKAKYPDEKPVAAVAFVNNRDERWQHALDILADYASDTIVTTFNLGEDDMPKKGMPVEVIAEYLSNKGKDFESFPDIKAAVRQLINRPEKLLLFTGSLYPLGSVIQSIQKDA